MNVHQCRATTFLHEPLRRSLATWLGGAEVGSMQRCALEEGHQSEHVGLPDAAGRGRFRWDQYGFHIGSTEGSDHGEGRTPFRSRQDTDFAAMFVAPPGKSTTTRPKGGRHAADAHRSVDAPNTRSPTEALWALTAAVERLADLIAADRHPPNSIF